MAETERAQAGPFEVTVDVMFSDLDTYEHIKAAGILESEKLRRLYRLPKERVMASLFYDQAKAYKFTFARENGRASGSFGERDLYAAQQHAPLLNLEVPL